MEKNTYCSYCGTKFRSVILDNNTWPRECDVCTETTWFNTIGAASVIQPVDDGILLVRRTIEPGYGELALPGGYMDRNETWKEAAAREMMEETNINVSPYTLQLIDVLSSAGKGTLVVFGKAPQLTEGKLPTFVPNDEVSDLVITKEPVGLAFPSHTEILHREFSRK